MRTYTESFWNSEKYSTNLGHCVSGIQEENFQRLGDLKRAFN